MSTNLRKLNVWWVIITQMGPISKLARQMDEFTRYYVLNALSNEGFFDYLRDPHTYDEILTQFDFVNNAYTHDLLEAIIADKRNTLVEKDGLYQINPDQTLPTIEDVFASTDKRYHNMTHYIQGMTQQIPARLRGEPIEMAQSFDLLGRQLTEHLDEVLDHRVYTSLRNAAFALLTKKEREWLGGKTLLDLGCGSGRETAELWLRLDGEVNITAVEPTADLFERARQNFPALLKEIDPNHPPLTNANTPVFQQEDAVHLPFEDNSFDAAFYSQVLHWTSDPHKAVDEIVRVVKPGGLIFGTQGSKPNADLYMDIIIRTDQNCHGFFWIDEYQQWYARHNIPIEIATPAGIFRARKPE